MNDTTISTERLKVYVENEKNLNTYSKVNACETLSALAIEIERLADEDGMIQGRNKKFDAQQMAQYCRDFDPIFPNILTREFGIRQQAMYIAHYSK